MRILAIDPGPESSAALQWLDGKLGLLENQIRNETIISSLPFFTEAYDVIAIEMVACYGMAVGKQVFETCVWIGRFIQASELKPRLVYRKDVKLHHCHNFKAKGSNVRMALIDKYGAPGTKKAPGLTYGLKDHLWSAFAIATYISETSLLPCD